MKITIIGAGNIGGATAKGLARGHQVTVTARSEKTLSKFDGFRNITTSLDNKEAVKCADMVILAVKPWQMEDVVKDLAPSLEGQTVVSMAPGIKPDDLLSWLGGGKSLAYAIPNTAMEKGESMTFVASVTSTEEETATVAEAFRAGGPVMTVPFDMLMAGTSLASCGIAYAFRYIEAAAKQGEKMGFSFGQAVEIVAQTVKGASILLLERGDSPAEETARVTTPGGLTLRGLEAMEKAGFSEAVAAGLGANK